MGDWFRLLAATSRTAPTRQQTLRAALDWSFDLLTDAERTVFSRLSVFSGGASLEGAEGVCAELPPDDVLDVLGRLADKSLVFVDAFAGAAWYRQLEPIRQYGRRRLSEAGELDDALDRHAAFYLALAERAAPALLGPEQVVWLARCEREQGNLRAAMQRLLECDEIEAALRLGVALAPFWEARGHYAEGRGRLEAALAAAETAGADQALQAQALAAAGRIAHQQTDFPAAEAFHEASLELARALDDPLGIASALTELGKEARLFDDYTRSAVLLDESLALCRTLGDRPALASALLQLGITRWSLQDPATARQLLEESLALYEEEGHLRLIAIAQAMLGLAAGSAGDLERSAGHWAEALTGHQRVGDWWFIIYDLRGLAAVLLAQGRPSQAALLWSAAHGLGQSRGEVFSPIGGATFEPVVEQLEAQLPPHVFAEIRERGLGLTRDEAVQAALHAAQLGETDQSPAAGPATNGPDALTRREQEVALLLAQGYTDRQIADGLSIAVSTVGVHVHHILAKLDLRSRHQVAGWASSQRLLDATTSPADHVERR
jgi:non-specific serine/threonine protein kinase